MMQNYIQSVFQLVTIKLDVQLSIPVLVMNKKNRHFRLKMPV